MAFTPRYATFAEEFFEVKNIGFVMLFSLVSVCAFSQQAIWTTVKDTEIKYVALNNVTKEVLKFYDQYEYYFDFTGFDKDSFIKEFDNDPDGYNWIYDIDETTIVAFRVPGESARGGGSIVFVFCVDKNNVNMIAFSNTYDTGANMTHQSRRSRFEIWFKTILE